MSSEPKTNIVGGRRGGRKCRRKEKRMEGRREEEWERRKDWTDRRRQREHFAKN